VISGLVVRWDDLSAPLISAILEAFARPTLDSLHLLNMRDVPTSAILRVLSSVKTLSLHLSDLKVEETPESVPPPGVSSVEHLMLSRSQPSTYELILSPHAPKLRNVSKLYLDTSARQYVERLLSSLAGTLAHLELDCGGTPYIFFFIVYPIIHIETQNSRSHSTYHIFPTSAP
jgi:hypothetical protein